MSAQANTLIVVGAVWGALALLVVTVLAAACYGLYAATSDASRRRASSIETADSAGPFASPPESSEFDLDWPSRYDDGGGEYGQPAECGRLDAPQSTEGQE